MSTVTVDLSKATPITPAPATGGAAPPVTVDMSKATPVQPPEEKEGFGGWLEGLGHMMRPVLPGGMQADLTPPTIGAAKAEGGGMGGLLDFMRWLGMKYIGAPGEGDLRGAFQQNYLKQHPGAQQDEIDQAYQQTAQQKVNDHMKDAADFLRKGTEPQGAGENIGYGLALAGEGEALPEMGAEDLLRIAGTRGMKAADMLANTKDLAATLTKNPTAAKYMAIGIKAAKVAAEESAKMYGQTYLHTEDPEEARKAAMIGGGLGLAAGGSEVGAQALRDRFGTKTIKIGSVEMPALARQVNEKGFAVPGRAEEAPKIQAAQEAGFQQVVGHTAREATRNALTAINETRPMLTPISDESRLLQAPPIERPTFTVEGVPTTETQEGSLTQRAEPIPGREMTAGYGGPPQPGFGPSFTPGSPFQNAPEPVPGHMHPVPDITGPTPEEVLGGQTPRPPAASPGRGDVVGGGGPLTTNSLPEAEGWLSRFNQITSSPDFEKLPAARQTAILGQQKALQDQLDMFYAGYKGHPAYTQRFTPIDPDEAANQVHTFGDAAAQVEAAAKPVYQRLDQLSNGEFTKLRQQSQAAKATMRRAGSIDAYDAAEERYHQANAAIGDLIDRSSPNMTQQDYQATRNAWRQSRRLDELDTIFERMMNGVTHEEGEIGMPRYIDKARVKPIQKFLDSGTNQEQIQQLIGREGIINLKNVTNLLSERATSSTSQNLMRETMMQLMGHFGRYGYGALAGGALAGVLGMDVRGGAAAGAVTADALRWGWRYAATTPRVGQMVDMAVRNQVGTKVAAPLIARAIAQAAGLFKPDQKQEENQEEGGEK